jgi:hypothetical protein
MQPKKLKMDYVPEYVLGQYKNNTLIILLIDRKLSLLPLIDFCYNNKRFHKRERNPMNLMKRKILFFIFFMTVSFSCFASTSKDLQLREAPQDNAKVIATLAQGKPYIPIFTQGNWTKIGDPSNGNVGWINNTQLESARALKIFIRTQETKPNSNANYQVIEFSGNPFDQTQIDNFLKQMQSQQANFQKLMNQFIEQNADSFKEMAKQLQNMYQSSPPK